MVYLSKAEPTAKVLVSVNEWTGPSPWSAEFGVHAEKDWVTIGVEVMGMSARRSLEEIEKADAATVGELYGELKPKITAFAHDDSAWQIAIDRLRPTEGSQRASLQTAGWRSSFM